MTTWGDVCFMSLLAACAWSCHPLFGPGTIDYSRPDLTDRGPPLHDTTLQHQDEAPAFRRGDGGTE